MHSLFAGLSADAFLGTNTPNSYSEFSITVGADITNLSLKLPGNASGYSYLFLRKGAAPSETVYDFSSKLDGQTNDIHLEQPEVSAGTYFIRVRTPATSATHSFTVQAEGNCTGMRTSERPVSKPLGAVINSVAYNGQWHHFRVEPRTNSMWRATVDSGNNVSPDLYVQSSKLASTSSYLSRSTGTTNDIICVNGGSTTYYYVGLLGSAGPTAGAAYTLRIEPIIPKDLAWDPGESHLGTRVYTNQSTAAGDYYFRVITGNPSLGAWRTALRLFTTNEASLFLAKGRLPSPTDYNYKSERLGSKGIVLALSSQFQASEEWFLMVRAKAGAQWTLVSGDPYVQNLGLIAKDDSSSSGDVEVGPEGMRFFSASAPAEMLAWGLWLHGATNAIYLKTNGVPLPQMLGTPSFAGSYQISQQSSVLVVPPYLSVRQYFIGVPGDPLSTISLDCRQQAITDLPYSGSVTQHVTGYPYNTYRIAVPPNEIAWQLYLTPTNGNPNLAVRRGEIPNATYNNGVSELVGNTPDYLTLVPPMLSDGTFYVTVYSTNILSTNNYQFTLQSGPAAITDISYSSVVTNDEPARVGWKFFRVLDVNSQLSSLGWDLFLQSYAPGTRIALRRSMAPSFWKFRNPNQGQTNCYEVISDKDFLQNPDQKADVWYVGVFNATEALGNFVLTTREMPSTTLTDNTPLAFENILPGRWEIFKIQLTPEDLLDTAPGGPVQGLDLRLTDVTSGHPTLVIRRERYPYSLINSNFYSYATNWASSGQWVADLDWTDRDLDTEGKDVSGRILTMAAGRPFIPGTYYVGVIDKGGTNNSNYKITGRWIGKQRTIPIEDLPWSGGRATATLAAREAKYYRVDIPEQVSSWKVRLSLTSGEAMMLITTNWIPSIESTPVMQKLDQEHYLLLPTSRNQYIPKGSYYIAVVSEGITPASIRHIGAGDSTFVLETLGEMPITPLGTLAPGSDLTITGSAAGGETVAFSYKTSPTSLGAWVSLEDTSGKPMLAMCSGAYFPDVGLADDYGHDGGYTSTTDISSLLISVGGAQNESKIILVKACGNATSRPGATFTLRVKEIVPDPLAFNGGSFDVMSRPYQYDSYYYVDVDGGMGWDIRLTNVFTGTPRFLVGRDYLPGFGSDDGFSAPFSAKLWPSGAWIDSFYDIGTTDWSDRRWSNDGLRDEGGQVLVVSRNRPLEPGRYYIRVINDDYDPLSYTILSRGIGDGYSIPITPLAFAAGQVQVTDLPPREAVYFKVEVPEGARSWKVQLSATAGESLLAVLKDTVPNILPTISGNTTNSGGRKMQKIGDEHFLLLPPPGQSTLSGGTYYLAVASEGNDATNSMRIGYGNVNFTLTSFGEADVDMLGTVGSTDLVRNHSLAGGEVRIYQFLVPEGIETLQARLENTIGSPCMALKFGPSAPYPGAASSPIAADAYGNEGGEAPGVDVKTSILSVANPTNGIYTLVVKARGSGIESPLLNVADAGYVLRIVASDTAPLDFDGGAISITDQKPATMRYFRVNVPTDTAGWDIRLTSVDSKSQPRLVVRRESLPPSVANTSGWTKPGTSSTWPTNKQWAPTTDWTRRTLSPLGTNETGRTLAVGLNRPLEPGTYFIGVSNASPTYPSTYTIMSRGIGEPYSIPIVDLPFVGSVTNSELPPREAAYYRVVVPSNAPSWKLQLTNTVGESMLAILRSFLPNFDTVETNSTVSAGKGMQRAGAEQFVQLPYAGISSIPAGTNYIVVVGEGNNPPSAQKIGTDSSSFVLSSHGALTVPTLGSVSSEELVQPDSLMSGEVKAYRFMVPPKTYGFRVLLQEREGNPVALVNQGDRLPNPGIALPALPADPYGNEGGYDTTNGHGTIVTVPNPVKGPYSVLVKARPLGAIAQNAVYTMRVQEILVPELNFTSEQNTNGLSHEVSGLLQDNERAFFKINIPQTLDGQPIIGWKLDLSQTSGQALMRVSREILPSDQSTNIMAFTSSTAIIAPPYLTNGTWFVEVKAVGSTYFRLRSSPLELERPAWVMPLPGDPAPTPGVALPFFADTAIAPDGTTNASEGTLLEQGALHYYAVQVPENNLGLLRAELRGINGQPMLYLRSGAVPTLSHNTNGASGVIWDRSITARTNTAYANWVPLNGRFEYQLQPGTWYIGVNAGGNSHALYRLMLSLGNITYLDMDGELLTNQVVAKDDWTYYRVDPPTALPVSFKVTFSQEYGDVVMYLRDTLPPGNGKLVTDLIDWDDDDKNINQSYPSYDAPGTYSFTSPPIRPGQPLYLGFRAQSQAIFNMQIAADPVPTEEPTILEFYSGMATTNLQPHSAAIFRVDAPSEATRWRHFSAHPTNIVVYMEQGAVPTPSAYRWRSYSTSGKPLANSTNNTPLATWVNKEKRYYSTNWPWVPGQSYFLLVTNITDSSQEYTIQMQGRNADLSNDLWDDNDQNNLPDVWELTYFGATGVVPGWDDDLDSVINEDEYLEGTSPVDPTDFRARLSASSLAGGGTVVIEPEQASYALGSSVVFTAIPDPGFSFIRWSEGASGAQNPLTIHVNSHLNVYAEFKGAGDDFTSALPLFGSYASVQATNVGFTKETGEPFHAGNPGGKSIWWRWTAPGSGQVTISTAGSTFNTLLAVYTGNSLSGLSLKASDNNSLGGTNRSRVTFSASAGETYSIAVDGYNGASARISMTLSMSGVVQPPKFGALSSLPNGSITMQLSGEPGESYVVEYSENLAQWHSLGTVTTATSGAATVTDAPPQSARARFYRARAQ
jgi:hypothetical protein